MNGQRGKITFMNLIVFVILVFGGFMAFKYIASGIEKKQIKKEIFDTLGSTRGADPDDAKIMAVIESVLEKKEVEILEVSAERGQEQSHDLLFLQVQARNQLPAVQAQRDRRSHR